MTSLASSPVGASTASESSVSVLAVHDDPDFLEVTAELLAETTDFEVHTETSAVAAIDRLDGVDCVVTDYDMPERDGLELLATVRDRRPRLPVVVCTGSATPDVVDAALAHDWTDVVCKDGAQVTALLLARRVCQLVDRRRTTALAERAMAAVDEATDGLAVVTPDDRFAMLNRAYARRFGYQRDALLGRDWRTCYPDDEVARLESTALETIAGDWQWTGGCVGERADGSTFTAHTRFVGLDDGSVVFCVSSPAEDDDAT